MCLNRYLGPGVHFQGSGEQCSMEEEWVEIVCEFWNDVITFKFTSSSAVKYWSSIKCPLSYLLSNVQFHDMSLHTHRKTVKEMLRAVCMGADIILKIVIYFVNIYYSASNLRIYQKIIKFNSAFCVLQKIIPENIFFHPTQGIWYKQNFIKHFPILLAFDARFDVFQV